MTTDKAKAQVYFLPWDRRKELPELLERSGAPGHIEKGDWCAVKMHFGERGNDGYIRPEYVRPVLRMIKSRGAKPFLTDTCTIYHGPRNNAIGHLEVAAEHGFTQTKLQAPVIIADGMRGSECGEVEVEGRHFKRVKIANGILESDSMMVLSHFKGHLLAGFGGAIKNLGMGCGARIGKFEMHSAAMPTLDGAKCVACGACVEACAHGAAKLDADRAEIDGSLCVGCGECVVACPTGAISVTWSEGANGVQERMVEYAIGAVKGRRTFCVNFLNHITPNCDCMSKKEGTLVPDIGILASSDPVAIDQACFDLVLDAGGDVFKAAHPGVDGEVQLARAAELGLGVRGYDLIQV